MYSNKGNVGSLATLGATVLGVAATTAAGLYVVNEFKDDAIGVSGDMRDSSESMVDTSQDKVTTIISSW